MSIKEQPVVVRRASSPSPTFSIISNKLPASLSKTSTFAIITITMKVFAIVAAIIAFAAAAPAPEAADTPRQDDPCPGLHYWKTEGPCWGYEGGQYFWKEQGPCWGVGVPLPLPIARC